MQKTYPNVIILRSLLLAPLPVLFGWMVYLCCQPTFFDHYEGFNNLALLIKLSLAVYLIYIFIISPCLFIILYFLNRTKHIHFFTLTCIAYFSTILLTLLGNYFKDHDLPNTLFEFKKIFILNPLLLWTVSTAIAFWLFLKWHDYRNRSDLNA